MFEPAKNPAWQGGNYGRGSQAIDDKGLRLKHTN
jgi:hypothetical protein